MKAIINLSGKQYHIGEGDIIEVFKLNHKKGEQFTINDVALIEKDGVLLTDPDTIKNYSIVAEVLEEKKGKKVLVFKKKKKTEYKRKKGHRDYISVVKILKIQSPDGTS